MLIKAAILLALLAASPAIPVEPGVVAIVRQENEIMPDGSFHWGYESGDGSKSEQSGRLRVSGKDSAEEVFSGSFEYMGDEGKVYRVTYEADETGYHPQGEHIPKIPALIQKSLDFLATLPPQEEEGRP